MMPILLLFCLLGNGENWDKEIQAFKKIEIALDLCMMDFVQLGINVM